MMKLFRIAIASLLLLAGPASASTFFFDFSHYDSASIVLPCDPICSPGNPIVRDGISATFSKNWAYTEPYAGCTEGGMYDIYWIGYWGIIVPGFKNAPSMPSVGWLCSDPPNTSCGGESGQTIIFDPPIRFFSMWYSTSIRYRQYACPGWTCNGGPYCDNPGPMDPSNQQPSLYFVNGAQSFGKVFLPRVGDTFYEAGCDGNVQDLHCQWHYVSISSTNPMPKVVINAAISYPFLIDDIVATTSVSSPYRATPTDRMSWGRIKSIYR
jgi:hypothetical protein